ncbi:MAG: radical SAM protein [Oscillospiraceae bacterium]|nr:radical SAM protein [Oscillospiraceae bacterium]
MADNSFVLEEYLVSGVENIVQGAVRATLKDPRESIFMARFALASKAASKRRAELESNGEHMPAFLIASITSNCNLHCAGCFAREVNSCSDEKATSQLSADDWKKVFTEAKELGISFIVLVGGEPLIRKDVLQIAANIPDILFPVFTNGTLMNDSYMQLFDKARNLVPVFSIEGERMETDRRRGTGIYQCLISKMDALKKDHIPFGASITVTTSNLDEVTSDDFISVLQERGCKVVFFVEYIPAANGSQDLAPQDAERLVLDANVKKLREAYPEMLFISFPGDEKRSGGCLAAGRGFFHINSHGGAEPCPLSPYSDINVKETSIREALHSKLFSALRDGGVLTEDHIGGCVLFERKDQVEQLLNDE